MIGNPNPVSSVTAVPGSEYEKPVTLISMIRKLMDPKTVWRFLK